ncbi:MAG: TMEM165/GDT1 family protein [Pseudobdellovibrio sp.]
MVELLLQLKIIFQSFLMVVASEFGDKTQLLALVLASRFKKPMTIMAGILVATLLNHGLASYFGTWISSVVNPEYLRWGLSFVFIAFGLWILIPDKDEELKETSRYGAFWTTAVVFFLAEMGDKTQLATVALGAKFQAAIAVTIGTTLGMLVADGLAVFFGKKLTEKVSMKMIRYIACGLFIIFGFGVLFY